MRVLRNRGLLTMLVTCIGVCIGMNTLQSQNKCSVIKVNRDIITLSEELNRATSRYRYHELDRTISWKNKDIECGKVAFLIDESASVGHRKKVDKLIGLSTLGVETAMINFEEVHIYSYSSDLAFIYKADEVVDHKDVLSRKLFQDDKKYTNWQRVFDEMTRITAIEEYDLIVFMTSGGPTENIEVATSKKNIDHYDLANGIQAGQKLSAETPIVTIGIDLTNTNYLDLFSEKGMSVNVSLSRDSGENDLAIGLFKQMIGCSMSSHADLEKSWVSLVFPNPVVKDLMFMSRNEVNQVFIIASNGVKTELFPDHIGGGVYSISTNNLASGCYFLSYIDETGERSVHRFIKI